MILVNISGAWLEYIPYRDANRIFFQVGILSLTCTVSTNSEDAIEHFKGAEH